MGYVCGVRVCMGVVWAWAAHVQKDELLFGEGKTLGHSAPWKGDFFLA